MPGASVKSWGTSPLFNIGLYGYKKSAEVLAFIEFYNKSIRTQFLDKDDVKLFYNIFEDIKAGKFDDWGDINF